MIPTHIALGDGMSLSAIRTDRFKTACLTLSLPVMADAVRSPQDTLLLGVMGRGTARYPSLRDLNRKMDLLYDLTLFTRNYRMGDLQILGSGTYFLDPAYIPMRDRNTVEYENVRMLAENFYAPLFSQDGAFTENHVALEREVQCDVIRDEMSQPAAYAEKRIRELSFAGEGHGVSLYGTVPEVERITRDMLTERYLAFWKHADLHFFYVGSSEPERVAEQIRRAFADEAGRPYTDGAIRPAQPPVLSTRRIGGTERWEETLPVSQGKLVMLLDAGADLRTKDVYTAMVYNEILGGSPLSKLFVNVREKKSLCYYCSSMFDAYKGYFSIASGIRVDHREAAEAEILHQIEEIRRGNVSAAEHEAAVKYLVSVYTGLYDSASALENYYLAREIYGVSSSPEAWRAGIASVTREDVIAFAEQVSLRSVYFLRGTRIGGAPFGEEEME